MPPHFDDDLLQDFIHGHYGYGNYASDYWFIGMEEGGGNSFEEISARLKVWESLGRGEVEDVAEYHLRLGMPKLFTDPVILQSTWNKLIRVLLSSQTKAVITEQVRQYQRDRLGRLDGETCLIELLPLPSPSTNQWLYAQHSGIDFLASREAYLSSCTHWRCEHIRGKIIEYGPTAVIFYGMAYTEWWKKIARVPFIEDVSGDFLTGRNLDTTFMIMKHPVANGLSNEYFALIGKALSKWIDHNSPIQH